MITKTIINKNSSIWMIYEMISNIRILLKYFVIENRYIILIDYFCYYSIWSIFFKMKLNIIFLRKIFFNILLIEYI